MGLGRRPDGPTTHLLLVRPALHRLHPGLSVHPHRLVDDARPPAGAGRRGRWGPQHRLHPLRPGVRAHQAARSAGRTGLGVHPAGALPGLPGAAAPARQLARPHRVGGRPDPPAGLDPDRPRVTPLPALPRPRARGPRVHRLGPGAEPRRRGSPAAGADRTAHRLRRAAAQAPAAPAHRLGGLLLLHPGLLHRAVLGTDAPGGRLRRHQRRHRGHALHGGLPGGPPRPPGLGLARRPDRAALDRVLLRSHRGARSGHRGPLRPLGDLVDRLLHRHLPHDGLRRRRLRDPQRLRR